MTRIRIAREPRAWSRAALLASSLQGACLITGCVRAPSFSILGSYFPSWIICIVIGILLAVAARQLFRRLGIERELAPLALIYSCLACFFACTIWLVFFS